MATFLTQTRIKSGKPLPDDERKDGARTRQPIDHAVLRQLTSTIGTKVYMAGSPHMWWQPLNAPDHATSARVHSEVTGREVLVVEDESYLADLIADVLQAEGHRTRSASNGREALDTLADYTPDLILLDLMMPVMDGWEVMHHLKSDPRLAQIPVVIITAIYSLKSTQQDTGAKAVLTKPFDIDQLAEVVRIYAA